jgi:hypothetical protein
VTTKLGLQKIVKGLLHIEEESRVRQEDSRKNKPFLLKKGRARRPVNKI